jgi:hypothetical protein
LTSAKDEKGEFAISLLGWQGIKFFPDWITDEDSFSFKVRKRALKRDNSLLHPGDKKPVGKTRVEVLL